MILNGSPGNITQIPNRRHTDLQALNNNDHPWYSAEPNRLAITTFTEGLDASKTATPSAGSVYYATDTVKVYICFVTNTWTQVDDVAVPHGAAQGDIIYFNGTNWARLTAGTAGNVLTTQGASANPTWTSSGLASAGQATGLMTPSGTGSYSITGLGWQPSRVDIIMDIAGHGASGAANSWSYGSKIGSNAVVCTWGQWDSNNGNSNGSSTTNIINLTGNQGVSGTVATFTSFDSGGFTVNFTSAGTTSPILYIAYK